MWVPVPQRYYSGRIGSEEVIGIEIQPDAICH